MNTKNSKFPLTTKNKIKLIQKHFKLSDEEIYLIETFSDKTINQIFSELRRNLFLDGEEMGGTGWFPLN